VKQITTGGDEGARSPAIDERKDALTLWPNKALQTGAFRRG